MASVIRYDRGEVEAFKTDEGFLYAQVTIARTGVFPYLRNGKLQREAKIPEELFRIETLNSIRLKPVTDLHPPETDNRGLVVPANYKTHVRGTFGDAVEVVENKLIRTREIIFDADLIAALERGEKREVSIGFECELDHTPGVTEEGEAYEVIQRNIIVNHLAHVPRGRAGESVKVHLDASEFTDPETAIMIQEDTMGKQYISKVTTDGDPTPAAEAGAIPEETIKSYLKDLFSKLFGTSETATADEVTKLRSQVETLKGELSALKPKEEKPAGQDKKESVSADELEKLIQAGVTERTKLIETAKSVIKDFKSDGVSDKEIKLQVIKTVIPNRQIAADASDDFIDATFAAAQEFAKEKFFVSEPPAMKSNGVTIDQAYLEDLRQKRYDMRTMNNVSSVAQGGGK